MIVRPRLPNSLKKKQRLKILSRLLPCLVLLLFNIIVLIYFGELLKSKYEIGNIIIRIALVIAPFLICGVPFKLIDSFWSGTVSEISVEEKTATETIGGRPWPYLRHELVLTVTGDNGKKIKYKEISLGEKDPRLFVQDTGNISNVKSKYHKGEALHKYYGFSHPFAENRDGKICISCGNVNNAELRVCSFCQSELLSVTCHSPDEDDNLFPNN